MGENNDFTVKPPIINRIGIYGMHNHERQAQHVQLELLELEPAVSNLEARAESEREAEPVSPNHSSKRKRPNCQVTRT
jgi:hypothetical protein